jgi:hypothetical protein
MCCQVSSPDSIFISLQLSAKGSQRVFVCHPALDAGPSLLPPGIRGGKRRGVFGVRKLACALFAEACFGCRIIPCAAGCPHPADYLKNL